MWILACTGILVNLDRYDYVRIEEEDWGGRVMAIRENGEDPASRMKLWSGSQDECISVMKTIHVNMISDVKTLNLMIRHPQKGEEK